MKSQRKYVVKQVLSNIKMCWMDMKITFPLCLRRWVSIWKPLDSLRLISRRTEVWRELLCFLTWLMTLRTHTTIPHPPILPSLYDETNCQDWAHYHTAFGIDNGGISSLSDWETCPSYLDGYVLLCRRSSWSVGGTWRSARTKRISWIHVHRFIHHLWTSWTCWRKKWVHHANPHLDDAEWW